MEHLINNAHSLALALVEKPKGNKKTLNANGITKDIIEAILSVYDKYKHQTKEFSKYFDDASIHKITGGVWSYVRHNIKYIKDDKGEQLIKSPSATIHSGFGDCKAYSILIASILHHLNIDFAFRFIGFEAKKISHVYIVAYDNGQEIYIDACLPEFDKQVNFKYKEDFNMTQISEISGIEAVNTEEVYNNSYGGFEHVLDINGLSVYEPTVYDNMPAYYQTYRDYHDIGFLGKAFKKIGEGIKNAATFVKDKVVKPIVNTADGIAQFLPIPGLDKVTGLAKKVVSIGDKTLTVVDKATGQPKAVDLANLSEAEIIDYAVDITEGIWKQYHPTKLFNRSMQRNAIIQYHAPLFKQWGAKHYLTEWLTPQFSKEIAEHGNHMAHLSSGDAPQEPLLQRETSFVPQSFREIPPNNTEPQKKSNMPLLLATAVAGYYFMTKN